jgi:putative (di)nucleoside polyphosphate hydrolase
MKAISHGILVLNAAAELLLCHATGTRHWDILKGAAAAGESSVQAALREAQEECGLRLEADALVPVGRFAYRPRKDLALHAVLVERFDTGRCACSSFFRDRQGRLLPEMDAFRWTAFADVPHYCATSMTALLTQGLSLPDLLARLVAGGHDAQGAASSMRSCTAAAVATEGLPSRAAGTPREPR